MKWRQQDRPCAGTALFPGTLPPRLEEMQYLTEAGIRMSPGTAGDCHWSLKLEHPQWGKADLVTMRNMPEVPRFLIDHDPRLSPAEREQVRAARSPVSLMTRPRQGDVLRDRKMFLRFLRAVMGRDSVAAIDHSSHHLWSAAALDEELCHDAPLDIESLFTIHMVTQEGRMTQKQEPTWCHTHGLAELGFFDFDIMEPSEDVTGRARDLTRPGSTGHSLSTMSMHMTAARIRSRTGWSPGTSGEIRST